MALNNDIQSRIMENFIVEFYLCIKTIDPVADQDAIRKVGMPVHEKGK